MNRFIINLCCVFFLLSPAAYSEPLVELAAESKIKVALETLSTLRAEGFARHSAEELGLDRPGWVVELRLKDGPRQRLEVGSVEKEGVYGLVRHGSDDIYTLRKYTLDRFLLEPKSYK